MKTNKMADLPLTQIREKKFRQHYGSGLDQFTDQELLSRYRFGRESMKYLVEVLKNDLKRQTRRKHKLFPHVVTTLCNKFGQYKTWTADCGLLIEYKNYVTKTGTIISR